MQTPRNNKSVALFPRGTELLSSPSNTIDSFICLLFIIESPISLFRVFSFINNKNLYIQRWLSYKYIFVITLSDLAIVYYFQQSSCIISIIFIHPSLSLSLPTPHNCSPSLPRAGGLKGKSYYVRTREATENPKRKKRNLFSTIFPTNRSLVHDNKQ